MPEPTADVGVYVRAASRMLEAAAQDPAFMQAAAAFDWSKILQLLPAIVPLIIQLLTGGTFNPALITALIQAIASIFGLSQAQVQQAIAEAHLS